MGFIVEKLKAYQRAVDLADDVFAIVEGFSRGYGFLADQLNRAVLSIPTNIAEGNGRYTAPDRRNFFVIARGSLQECVPLLELARRRGMITTEDHFALKDRLNELARMVSGLILAAERR